MSVIIHAMNVPCKIRTKAKLPKSILEATELPKTLPQLQRLLKNYSNLHLPAERISKKNCFLIIGKDDLIKVFLHLAFFNAFFLFL